MNIFNLKLRSVKSKSKTGILQLLKICYMSWLLLVSLPVMARSQSITLPSKTVTISKFFSTVEKQTGYMFLYSEVDLDVSTKVSFAARTATLHAFLEEFVKSRAIKYDITPSKYIVLSKMSTTPRPHQQKPVNARKTIRAKGVVIGNDGQPVIGATVKQRGSDNATVTDINGQFVLDVPSGAMLEFAYVGAVTKELKAGTNMSVKLADDVQMLNDIVVVGYGTLQRREVTSSITSISSKDLLPGQGGATVASLLKGKISGMTINETSSPNAGISMQLRGVTSINASSAPLVVIDGIPGGDIRSLSQEDIRSIDVLKDASAGAIYGTRAAGGVILITTRKASEGPIRLSYTGEMSTEQAVRKPEILNRNDFLRFGLGDDYGADTNWYNALLNEGALSHRHVVNLSGGTHTAQIYATFLAQKQKGIAIGDDRTDYSGRINSHLSLLDNLLEVTLHTEYREAHRHETSRSSYFNMALKMNPTIPAYDSTSDTGYNVLTGGDDWYNPLAEVKLKQDANIDKWIQADATLKVNLPYGLFAQGTFGWETRDYQATHYTSAQHRLSLNNNYSGNAYHGYSKTVSTSFEPTVNFIHTYAGRHNVKAVAGYSFWQSNSENFNMRNYNFPVDGVGPWDMGSGTYLTDGKASMYSHKYPRERLIAFFGRANYSYDDKYMLTASLRHEGSSKFGHNHKWGNFWAVSGGWRISKENFMRNLTFIDDLKLRLGYGITGNNNFTSSATTLMYSSNSLWPYNDNWLVSYGPANNVNYDLHWEQTAELNLGLDYSLLHNRLYGKVDVYSKKVSGMLYNITVPNPPAIYDNTTMNYGDLKTTGWEIEIGGVPLKTKDFSWTTSMRLSHFSSKITSLWGNKTYQDRVYFPAPGTNGSGGRIEEGTKIGSYFIWKYAGLTNDGRWLLYDRNENIILSSQKTYDDKRYIGNAIPRLIVSWDHTFTYRNLSLGINLRSWLDFDVFNTINMYYGLSEVEGQNVLRSAFIENRHIKEVKQLCDYWLEDGSFLKIDAISLGYTLNMKKWQKYIDHIDIYCTCRNVACFTKYSGLNPEVNINGLDPGYEWFNNIYPETRRYTLGMKITF